MKKIAILSLAFLIFLSISPLGISAASDREPANAPGGKLYSNAWRSPLTSSGNTYKFEYQVSAEYSGSKTVEYIRTSWKTCASLRNSASISIGVSAGEVSAGSSSSWQNTCQSANWTNSNGSKTASWRSNAVITPRADYRSNTVSIQNTARVKIKGYAQPTDITASV